MAQSSRRLKFIKQVLALLLAFAVVLSMAACSGGSGNANEGTDGGNREKQEQTVTRDGEYDSRDEVAEYISLYGELPRNYITKGEARKLGWRGGSLEEFAPGKTIGGDRFGNREKKLPMAGGRVYYECDIDTRGEKSRGPKRIVYSSDGLIYYTSDHYNSFVRLE